MRRLLAHPAVAAGLYLAALGEIAVDKLPFLPNRIDPAPLGARVFIGALAGSILSRQLGGQATLGATCGAVGALAGSYAGYHARTYLSRSTSIPDPAWAVVEDVTAVGLGYLATRPPG